MNRRKIIGLVALMAISLFGIIWVQITWIEQAIRVRNEQFDRSVAKGMGMVVEKLEKISDMQFLMRTDGPDSLIRQELNRPITVPQLHISPPSGNYSDRSFSYIIEQSYFNGNESNVTRHFHFEESGVIVDDKNERMPYIITSDPGTGSLAVVDYQQYLENILEKRKKLDQISRQMVREIYDWESTYRLRNVDMRKQLDQAFYNVKLETPYQYSIIDNGRIIAGSFTDTAQIYTTPYQVKLYPGDVFQKNLRLSVHFPERKNYILRSMSLLLGGSAIFSLVILISFGLSLWFIIRQKRISEMKSDFINNMTHEFKTPIATISLASDSILNQKVIAKPDQIKYFTGMIQKENNRMNKQVESILQIASMDKKDFQLQFQDADLHQIIEKAIHSIQMQVEKRGGEVHLFLEAEKASLIADPLHTTNMIYNLLDNANKYSPEAPDITVRTKNQKGGVILRVEDRGMGMNRTVQTKIFERFYRQTSGNIHNVKGFGLGLSYVKAIVEAHRGWIKVQSEPGNGSIFSVFLPFKPDVTYGREE